MEPIFSQRGQTAPRDRFDRLAALGPDDKTAGFVWLAMHYPAVCDAVLDTLESCARDDAGEAGEEAEPYCAVCGASRSPYGVMTPEGGS